MLEVYKNKKVFLTGHTGFKGSWMLAWLNQLGAEVKGYALAPENNDDLFNILKGDSMCHSIIADLRDKNRLNKEIQDFQPDIIFHFAAQPLVRKSYAFTTETFEVNALGTAYLLESLKRLEKRCSVVIVTTDKVYENKEWEYPYREIDTLGGYDPYSASKAAAEIIVNSYRSSFFNIENFNNHQKSIATARAGNVIGAGDWAKDRIIPDIIRALKANENIKVRNPNSVRPWQHVLEPLNGYLTLGKKLLENPILYAGAWNFGPYVDDNLKVEELVKIAIKSWGCGNYETPNLEDQPHEAGLLMLDINKSINCLGWRPKWNAKTAINFTINGYKNLKASTINNQIIDFQNKF
jgi:CDP-glucose 4,6-dehydratase